MLVAQYQKNQNVFYNYKTLALNTMPIFYDDDVHACNLLRLKAVKEQLDTNNNMRQALFGKPFNREIVVTRTMNLKLESGGKTQK